MITDWDNAYSHRKWRRIRAQQMKRETLCEWCKVNGWLKPAEVVHHATPHKGDRRGFFHGELVSLCKSCHDIVAQGIEARGYSKEIGPDGWPIDPRHPANR